MAEEREPEEGEPEEPQAVKPKVKAVLKPRRIEPEDELAGEVYSLKDRLDRLEAQKAPSWREVGEKQSKPVGTNFDSELLDRMNKTIQDYEKSGVKLYKRKLFEEGLEEQLDVLNSTAEIDDAFEKACKNMGWGKEAPNVKVFVEHIEGIEDWVWTSERARYALNLFRGRPEKIEELLNAEPVLRQFVDYAAIERLKRAAKGKLPKGAESGDLLDELGLGDEEEEGEGKSGEKESGEEEDEFPFGETE